MLSWIACSISISGLVLALIGIKKDISLIRYIAWILVALGFTFGVISLMGIIG